MIPGLGARAVAEAVKEAEMTVVVAAAEEPNAAMDPEVEVQAVDMDSAAESAAAARVVEVVALAEYTSFGTAVVVVVLAPAAAVAAADTEADMTHIASPKMIINNRNKATGRDAYCSLSLVLCRRSRRVWLLDLSGQG